MPERLTPGVYVEEVSGGVRPIQGVGTSTAGFIGEAARGIPNRAEFINGFRDFDRKFGGHRRGPTGFLAQSVQAFFDAGGRRAYVVRVLPSDAVAGVSNAVTAREADAWGIRRQTIQFDAKGNGAWSDYIRIHIEPSTSFRNQAFQVRVEWTESGRSRTVERFDNVRMDPEHEDYVVRVIDESSRYIRATDLFEGSLNEDPRQEPPIPESVAALNTQSPIGGAYQIPQGTRLEFRWNDNTSSAGAEQQVEFDSGRVAAVGSAFDANGIASLTPGQLRQLLQTALGNPFRVSGPAVPAEVTSAAGPWDTTDADRSVVSIDDVDQNLIFAQTTRAEIDLGAGTFNISEGDTIDLTVNGQLQSYTLAAGDVTDAAATVAELVTVFGREFTGIQVFDQGGSLILRTDARGTSASLVVAGTAAVGLGDPTPVDPASGSGNVSDPAAVTSEELAAIFNAIADNPFRAQVDGNRVRFVQIDFESPHTIRWVSDAGPDTIVDDTDPHTGPTAAENVRVEPAVASRSYLLLQTLAVGGAFDFSATNGITLTATDGTSPTTFDIDVSGDGNLTPDLLRQRIQAALDAGTNTYEVGVEDAGDYVTLSAAPNDDEVTLSVSVDAGTPWQLPQSIAGAQGALVDSLNGVEILVSEEIQPGLARVLPDLFGNVRVSGLDENHQANPHLRPRETEDDPLRLRGASDGSGVVSLSQYIGSVTSTGRSGLRAFDTVDINILVIPGKNSPGFLSAAMAYCDANDVFFVADGAGSDDRQFQMSADDVRQFVEGLPARSNNAAMFYPWVEVPDAVGVGRNPKRFVPPSGHVAGVFARTDATRGVWKAPAGIEASMSGAIDLQHRLVDADQDLLNPIGLNCIRQFPNVGIVSWGSRTLSSDPEWRYVPVRRTALFLKASLQRGLTWAVFEPNDQELWDRIRINTTAFMLGLFRQQAFQGATPDEAFRVKCDRETNPQELVDQGIVTAQVAFAPLKPAEFVVIEVSQKALVA